MMRKSWRGTLRLALVGLVLAACGWTQARAEVRLPKVFGSHMVLQRDTPITVWGWAAPDEAVSVQVSTASGTTHADARGEWKVVLPRLPAGGPYTFTVTGANTIKLDDVLVGEVWLASGQSNMEMGITAVMNGRNEAAAADNPQIRLLKVPKRWTPDLQTDMEGAWKPCTPASVVEEGWGGFSAVAYFFGRELNRRLHVPIGLIDASWGGTCIQTWTPPEGFAAVPALRGDYDRLLMADPKSPVYRQHMEELLQQTEAWLKATRTSVEQQVLAPAMPAFPDELRPPHDVQNATALYNGMIRPLCPFALRGAIWYQGESNLAEGKLYTERMKALIGGWRQLWRLGDFPFYFVQVAPFNYGGGTNPRVEAEFWVAQAAAQSIPNTGMAVTNDIGNITDIHPTNKQEVGRRLALWALAKSYGQRDVVCTGPTFRSMQADGDRLRVTFDNAEGGLKSRDGKPPSWFQIADADEGGYVDANATIDGPSVVLSAPGVHHPVAMRYAWSMFAQPNLMNGAGLPAGAFRAGELPKRDLLAARAPEAAGYSLVYDLDLSKLAHDIKYDVDNHAAITKPFDRIAYFLELQDDNGDSRYLYVSMDAFTTNTALIGVPTVASGAHFQQNVAHMNVLSNVKEIVTGNDLAGGNIEFWPNNYSQTNSAGVPNASDATFDFGDQPSDPVDGYGCMQVHNHDAKQTLFAINHWAAGGGADLGIGNRPEKDPDWTFAGNAGAYTVKRLRVLVHLK
jgi:sialate O-acetylesterase